VGHFLGARAVILLGGISIAIGDLLFAYSTSLIFDFFINIFFGIGFAISMTASVKNACKYFPNKRGLINSIAGGFGGNLGSSTFNLIIKLFVSKGDYPRADDNNMYVRSTAENYKLFFYIHAFVAFFFGLLSCILLFPYENINRQNFSTMIEQNNIDRLPENINNEIKKDNDAQVKRNYKEDLKLILSHYRIYYLLTIFLFTSFLQGFILTVGFNFGTMNHGLSDDTKKIGGDEMSIIFMLMSSIACLSIGFAAFSATLNISSSASVSPNSDDFKVRFVGINGDNKVYSVNASVETSVGIISDDGLSISGLNVPMSKLGDGAEYEVYIENQGLYDAQIKKVGIKNIDGDTVNRRCVGDDVSPQLLSDFCSTITYGLSTFSEDGEKLSNGGSTGIVLRKGEKVVVRIAFIYDYDSWYVDGPVSIEFGDVYLDFGVYSGE
jgi:MFS family permease